MLSVLTVKAVFNYLYFTFFYLSLQLNLHLIYRLCQTFNLNLARKNWIFVEFYVVLAPAEDQEDPGQNYENKRD